MVKILGHKFLIKYIVSITLLAFLLTQLDFSALLHETGDLNIFLLLLSLILIICQIFFLNLRWHRYINVGNHNIDFKTSVLINIAGYFANILFITSVGGIIAKSGLAIRHGLSVTQALFATFLDRFMTLAALIIFSAISLPFLQNVINNELLTMFSLSIIGVIAIITLTLLAFRSGVLREFILSSRKRSRITLMLRSYIEDYELMLKTSLYSLIAQGFFILSVYTLSLGVNADVPIIEFLALMPVLALISSLPISFGGWGVREGAFIYGLGLIGFSMESAFMLSVQVGLITLIAPFIVGLPYLFKADLREFLLNTTKS